MTRLIPVNTCMIVVKHASTLPESLCWLRWLRCALASRPVCPVRRVRRVCPVFGSRCAGSAALILRTFVRPPRGRNMMYLLPRDSLALIHFAGRGADFVQAALPPRKSPYLTPWPERSWRLQKGASPLRVAQLSYLFARLSFTTFLRVAQKSGISLRGRALAGQGV